MSVISEYIILTSILEEDGLALEQINAYLSTHKNWSNSPPSRMEWMPRDKFLAMPHGVMGGYFNHLDDKKFQKFLSTQIIWEDPNDVRMFWRHEHMTQKWEEFGNETP